MRRCSGTRPRESRNQGLRSPKRGLRTYACASPLVCITQT
jgi:hypothetical protein